MTWKQELFFRLLEFIGHRKMDLIFRKGDVIKPIKRTGLIHRALVWQDVYDGLSDFYGLMLTHSTKYDDNILMKYEHFIEGMEFVFDDTHFVNQLFLKYGYWGRFKKVGELSSAGISFVEEKLTNLNAIDFRRYSKSMGIKNFL